MICWELGEKDNSTKDLKKALDLYRLHNVGIPPHEKLAEIYIQMEDYDNAIDLCEEIIKEAPGYSIKNLLKKAKELRDTNTV
jgi:FimV-like protein